MKPITQELIQLWGKMSDLTKVKCGAGGKSCTAIRSTRCCDKMYCEITKTYAAENGVVLKETDHPELPFMGPTGCTVEPHLRPLCTLHQCSINSLGFMPGDPVWTKTYFELREKIELLDWERSK